MITDIHSHSLHPDTDNTIFNISINDKQMHLPHGKGIYFSVGIHPWDAAEFKDEWLSKMSILLTFSQMKAVGECGFDNTRGIPYEQQLIVFQHQITMSEALRKPILIHCVGHFNELISLRNKIRPEQAWIVHGFRGKPEMATQLVKAGFYLSYGPKCNFESVAATPIERIVAETDTANLPVKAVYEMLAGIKGCSLKDFTASLKLFGI